MRILLKTVVLILFSFCLYAQEAGKTQVRVTKNNAVLTGKYGIIYCPEGAVFTLIEKKGENVVVSGSLFGASVKGTMAAADVQAVDQGAQPAQTAQAGGAGEDDSEPPSKAPLPQGNIAYQGKSRPPEFFETFFKLLKNDFVLKNVKTREIVIKEKIPIIKSADAITKLNEGDVVFLEGQNNSMFKGLAYSVIMVYNEVYSRADEMTGLIKTNKARMSGTADYRFLAAYAPGKIPEQELPPGLSTKFIFQELGQDEAFMSKEEFLSSIVQGKTYQLKCFKCGGKGHKKDIKGRDTRCITCGEKGLLPVENTAVYVESETKKEKK